MIVDDWFIRLSELKFLLWRLFNPKLDVYLARIRAILKEELERIIEEKGGSIFESEEAFRQQRVLQ